MSRRRVILYGGRFDGMVASVDDTTTVLRIALEAVIPSVADVASPGVTVSGLRVAEYVLRPHPSHPLDRAYVFVRETDG